MTGPIEGDDEPIHGHFGLSYASYLVVPRVLLQSMPRDWQARFVGMLRELYGSFDEAEMPREGCRYKVTCRDEHGHLVIDELQDYERGRRRIPLKDNS